MIGTIDGGNGVVLKLLELLTVTLKLLMVAMVHTSAGKLKHHIICDFHLTSSRKPCPKKPSDTKANNSFFDLRDRKVLLIFYYFIKKGKSVVDSFPKLVY